MRLIKNLIILGLACSFNSCLMTNYMRTIPVEILKPAVFTIPDSINSIGIFSLTSVRKDDLSFEFKADEEIKKDSTINYKVISKECTAALANFLKGEGYFANVRNFGDSLEYLKSEGQSNNLYKKLNLDAYLFLDNIDFKLVEINDLGAMIVNNAQLIWSISYKNDSISYQYNQVDTLIYDGVEGQMTQKKLSERINTAVKSSTEYLGKAFGAKLIPTWMRVERMYYLSNNIEMRKAEVYAKNNQWHEAAKIWNKMSTNKNTMMAAKAAYNMALACEMEGLLYPAIDWLVKSYSILKENNKEHQENCQRYINVLAMRKKEIEKLANQIRN